MSQYQLILPPDTNENHFLTEWMYVMRSLYHVKVDSPPAGAHRVYFPVH